MSDKEIALELTKSYLEHLNVRANSANPKHSLLNVEGTGKVFDYFYNLVSKLDNTGK